MTKLVLTTPTVGSKDSVAEPQVTTAFKEVEKVVNGELEGSGVNIKAKTIDEGSLTTELSEKFTTRLGFVVKKENASFTAVTEKSYEQEKEGATCTLPANVANRIVSLIHIGTGSSKMKAPAGLIFGDFLAEAGVTEITLTRYQHVIVQADGTNWYIIGGEPKRTQTYGALTNRANNTEFEPSAIRPVQVTLTTIPKAGEASTLVEIFVGGVKMAAPEAPSLGRANATFIVPAGVKWKYVESGGVLELVQTSYLTL